MNAAAEIRPMARILDVSEEEYFRDPCSVPSLSQSIANVLLSKSPLHAWTEHPRLGNAPAEDDEEPEQRKETAATQRGKIVHKLLLGKGAKVAIISGFDNWKKKAAQKLRDAAKAAGQVPVLERVYEEYQSAAETIKANLATEYGVDLDDPDSESEVAIEWTEEGVRGPVTCRGRMDKVNRKRGLILDVKTIHSAHPDVCGKHAVDFGHDIQECAYNSALSKLHPELAGRIEMLFLNVEVKPPFAIYPGPLDGELRMLGEQRWHRAVFVWEECLRTNRWPAYANRITPIRAPGWAVTRWMERAQDW